jgi:hypothetical protein
MSRIGPPLASALLATSLSCVAATALAATPLEPEPDGLKPRFAIAESRLQATPDRSSTDGRYRLESRLQPEPGHGQHGSGMTLQAKLVDATATACDTGTIFANSFE